MIANNTIPENFRITSVDIRGDVMYIEGYPYGMGETKVEIIPIKISLNQADTRIPEGVKQL